MLMTPSFTGGSYMPIDVSYPIPLLEDIFSDSEPIAVFAEPSLTQFLPGEWTESILQASYPVWNKVILQIKMVAYCK